MERKLVRQGENALTVTLPSQWTKQYGLRAGNAIDLTIQNEILILSTAQRTTTSSVTFDAEKADRYLFWQMSLAAYLEGYDEIVILHPNEEHVVHFSQYMQGFVIDRMDKKKAILKSTISTPSESLSQLLSRARYQFLALAEAVEVGETYESVKRKERVMDGSLYFTMRYLKKYSNLQKDYKKYLLCTVLESAGDNVGELLKHNPSPQNVRVIVKAIKLFCNAPYDELYSYLGEVRKSMSKKTFADGMSYAVIETLYNLSGYVAQDKWN